MAENQYEQIIPWRLLKAYLKKQQAIVDHKLRRATDDQIKVLQGRSQQIEEMYNLPEALAGLAEDEPSVLQEERQ